ncbi:pseudouridine-5'-phosphatase-like [Culicoides brevitarsis]|uniref:pseudouridine-5'-phosphatase-like n=1 Tax=Culicoides brevitarsis TaxID=469753 RepID=UPI00307C5761
MAFHPVKVVIFDMDGTLLDTESVYPAIFEAVCQKYGKSFNAKARESVLGVSERRSCEITVELCELPCTVDEFQDEFIKISNVKLTSCALLPGVEKLLRHLNANNVPFALATSSGHRTVEIKIQNYLELFDMFHHKVTGTDPELKNGKPAPDIFLLAAQRFEKPVDPKDCLVIEDSKNGVKGARAAGMQCVMVPEKGIKKENTLEATLVLGSLEEFRPELFGLPAFT